MNAPQWLQSTIQEFGRGIGLDGLSLSGQDVASLTFETGATLRFEYAYESLAISMTAPARGDAESVKRILSYAHPAFRPKFKLRAGFSAKASRAHFVARLANPEVSIPAMTEIFQELWRIVEDLRGREAI